MPELKIEVDPAEVGLDAGRLERLDRYLAAYVDDGRLPGWQIAVTRKGRVAHLAQYGHRDIENGLPSEGDTLYRAWSMTKPVTSVAAMTLVEDGTIGLQDPVSRYIPAFENVRIYQRGPASRPVTTPVAGPIRIQHLLTHTSGLTYGFHRAHPVDEIYTQNGYEWATPPGLSLAECCEQWASFPLLFEPGTAWNYGVSSDVLGRVVEVASGSGLDDFYAERVLEPLGMTDTAFFVPPEKADRLAAFYTVDPATGRAVRADHLGAGALHRPACLSGSAGLVTTLADYHRFTQMLLGGGTFDGARVLGPRTVRHMLRNHLPGGADLASVGRPVFSEMPTSGVGFGLGFAVVEDPAAAGVPASPGEYAWHSVAGTVFWVDPVEEITVLFFTQLMPSSAHPLHSRLRQLVNQALVD
ncbi:serine hydrolase domain-containing protein [Streptomyces sp. NRRL F-5123]|uniref:serine hydrolase domain-containing protein n=1 Tax=Streptomyces sp. NRRL F-5123 TaxID=1463856 RepID=UPI0004E28B65|nr:serine hydrolase domain-containing protein [Streptomyces sp. NRRL F-5123]